MGTPDSVRSSHRSARVDPFDPRAEPWSDGGGGGGGGLPSAATARLNATSSATHFAAIPAALAPFVVDAVMVKFVCCFALLPVNGRQKVVVVGSGAYNPVHCMHLRRFCLARQFLEEHTEHQVLGGLLSPAHATEVRQRCR